MPEISGALRAEVRSRAKGRCEYCFVPESFALVTHEVDHIIAAKHGGATLLDNLALCCTLCNKYKGTDLASIDPETGEMCRLFHPAINGATIFNCTAVSSWQSRRLVASLYACFS